MANLRKSSATIAVATSANYTVAEAAELLGVSQDTVTRWCKTQKLPAFPQRYGTRMTFMIPKVSVDAKVSTTKKKQQGKPHTDYLPEFTRAMETVLNDGGPFSPKTVTLYIGCIKDYFAKYKRLHPHSIIEFIMAYPTHAYSSKYNAKFALLKMVTWMSDRHGFPAEQVAEIVAFKVRRNPHPKQEALTSDQLERIRFVCTPEEWTLVRFIASTGLRNSEVCSLKVGNIDQATAILKFKGKGLGGMSKTRRVRIPTLLMEDLVKYMAGRSKDDVLFPRPSDQSHYTPENLYRRLIRIGERVGLHLTAHVLRRSFVTINVNRGRSLVSLQLACGHTDIKVTRAYCKTTEDDMLEDMGNWDL